MSDNCLMCEVWKSEKEKALMQCDSIFDAAEYMSKFEAECSKSCNIKNSSQNS